mmetsp:Transcript_45632/g.99361  ORF Transcript_45632/g.99361 Transcript_45632/m.99361 type:complete len:280 (-) Transcript_45632:123-962(-)
MVAEAGRGGSVERRFRRRTAPLICTRRATRSWSNETCGRPRLETPDLNAQTRDKGTDACFGKLSGACVDWFAGRRFLNCAPQSRQFCLRLCKLDFKPVCERLGNAGLCHCSIRISPRRRNLFCALYPRLTHRIRHRLRHLCRRGCMSLLPRRRLPRCHLLLCRLQLRPQTPRLGRRDARAALHYATHLFVQLRRRLCARGLHGCRHARLHLSLNVLPRQRLGRGKLAPRNAGRSLKPLPCSLLLLFARGRYTCLRRRLRGCNRLLPCLFRYSCTVSSVF